jgi:hypothetical protein
LLTEAAKSLFFLNNLSDRNESIFLSINAFESLPCSKYSDCFPEKATITTNRKRHSGIDYALG